MKGGGGVLADLGSHFVHLARYLVGDIGSVFCQLGVKQSRVHPEGHSYQQENDVAIMNLKFKNHALGSIHVSCMAKEDTTFGQIHSLEIHGSQGTLHGFCDYDQTQEVKGSQINGEATQIMEIPSSYFAWMRTDSVHNTYKDIFRKTEVTARAFIVALANKREHKEADFREGWEVRRVLAAARKSALEQRMIAVT